MSGGYASRLSEYNHKGVCGLPELYESSRSLKNKLTKFAEMVQSSKYITVLTGAGISTSAGIPDFRGPKGIWTLEEASKKEGTRAAKNSKRPMNDDSKINTKRSRRVTDCVADDVVSSRNSGISKIDIKPNGNKSFETALPTYTHQAITKLAEKDIIKFVVTQNVDGLHRRSGLLRSKMSVLHGCVFTEKCELCGQEYFRDFDIGGVSFQKTGRKCTIKQCGGDLRDTVLDWEDELPDPDFSLAQSHCELSDLIICLGTSLRIEPAGSLPLKGDKFIIVNLQKTEYDSKANLILRAKVDDVMRDLMTRLGIEI